MFLFYRYWGFSLFCQAVSCNCVFRNVLTNISESEFHLLEIVPFIHHYPRCWNAKHNYLLFLPIELQNFPLWRQDEYASTSQKCPLAHTTDIYLRFCEYRDVSFVRQFISCAIKWQVESEWLICLQDCRLTRKLSKYRIIFVQNSKLQQQKLTESSG